MKAIAVAGVNQKDRSAYMAVHGFIGCFWGIKWSSRGGYLPAVWKTESLLLTKLYVVYVPPAKMLMLALSTMYVRCQMDY